MSFDKVAGVSVDPQAATAAEGEATAPSSIVHYTLKRDGYLIKIAVDRDNRLPRAVVRLESPLELRLKYRAEWSVRPGRGSPCGSYTANGSDPREFTFGWQACGKDVDRSELVMSFDVCTEAGKVLAEERLPFELKKTNRYWVDTPP